MGAGNFVRRRVVLPVIDLLKQGITPEKMALSIVIGGAFGVFPVLGTTTLLCTFAALILRLNMPAIQLVNYVVHPLQLLLLIPFIRFGEWLFRAQPLPFSFSQMTAMFEADFWGSMELLSMTGARAVVAWSIVMPPVAAGVYFVLVPALRAALAKLKTGNDAV